MIARVFAVALAAASLAASAPTVQGSLPLRHGRYVAVDAPCFGAPSSAESWFGGGYVLQSPHADCTVARVAVDRYRVVVRCLENGDRSLPFTLVERIRLIGHRQYELDNRFGHVHARWCAS
jgi:hypothetical protein